MYQTDLDIHLITCLTWTLSPEMHCPCCCTMCSSLLMDPYIWSSKVHTEGQTEIGKQRPLHFPKAWKLLWWEASAEGSWVIDDLWPVDDQMIFGCSTVRDRLHICFRGSVTCSVRQFARNQHLLGNHGVWSVEISDLPTCSFSPWQSDSPFLFTKMASFEPQLHWRTTFFSTSNDRALTAYCLSPKVMEIKSNLLKDERLMGMGLAEKWDGTGRFGRWVLFWIHRGYRTVLTRIWSGAAEGHLKAAFLEERPALWAP